MSEIQANLKVSVAPPSCAKAMSRVLIRGSQPAEAAAAAVPASSARFRKIRRVMLTLRSGFTPGRHSTRRISRRAFWKSSDFSSSSPCSS